jgi:hypothetical protein
MLNLYFQVPTSNDFDVSPNSKVHIAARLVLLMIVHYSVKSAVLEWSNHVNSPYRVSRKSISYFNSY